MDTLVKELQLKAEARGKLSAFAGAARTEATDPGSLPIQGSSADYPKDPVMLKNTTVILIHYGGGKKKRR